MVAKLCCGTDSGRMVDRKYGPPSFMASVWCIRNLKDLTYLIEGLWKCWNCECFGIYIGSGPGHYQEHALQDQRQGAPKSRQQDTTQRPDRAHGVSAVRPSCCRSCQAHKGCCKNSKVPLLLLLWKHSKPILIYLHIFLR